MTRYCQNCGIPTDQGAAFCPSCGTRIPSPGQSESVNQSAPALEGPPSGLMALIAKSFRRAIVSVKAYLKEPQKMVPMLVLAGIWLVLSILPAIGFNPWPVKLLSFATFAQGGLYGGFLAMLGGIIGKALFAFFISALVVPLIRGKASLKGLGSGLKRLLAGFSIQGIHMLPPLLTGIGISLVIFNFLSGNSRLVNSMPGLVFFVLAVRTLMHQGGFFWNLLLIFANKLAKGKRPSITIVQRFVSGFATGGLAGVGLSALPWPYLPYLLGLTLIIASIVLGIAAKSRKKAVPAYEE